MKALSARRRFRLTTPEQAVKSQLDRSGDRSVPPEAPMPETAQPAEGAVGRTPVELGVLLAQLAKRAAIRRAVLRMLRARVPPVLDRDGVDLPALPTVRERVHPQLPVLELIEGGVEAARVLEELAPGKRTQPDRVPVEQAIRVVVGKAQ